MLPQKQNLCQGKETQKGIQLNDTDIHIQFKNTLFNFHYRISVKELTACLGVKS